LGQTDPGKFLPITYAYSIGIMDVKTPLSAILFDISNTPRRNQNKKKPV